MAEITYELKYSDETFGCEELGFIPRKKRRFFLDDEDRDDIEHSAYRAHARNCGHTVISCHDGKITINDA